MFFRTLVTDLEVCSEKEEYVAYPVIRFCSITRLLFPCNVHTMFQCWLKLKAKKLDKKIPHIQSDKLETKGTKEVNDKEL